MVFVNFPQNLTEEEEMLQRKYAKLRKKKKALAALRAPKPEPPPVEAELKGKKRSAEAIADAMEKAKKLLKSGAIKVAEKKDLSFKRTKRQKEQDKSAVGFTPFSPTHTMPTVPEFTPEAREQESVAESSRPRIKGLYDSFVSSRQPRHDREDKEDKPELPKRGNTIYINGHGITEEIVRRTFSNCGVIINVKMEKDKHCGFITFEKMESAEQAINEMNGSMVGDTQLKVSMARRQPTFENIPDQSRSTWSTIAANQSQKSTYKDQRDLVAYEDDGIFDT